MVIILLLLLIILVIILSILGYIPKPTIEIDILNRRGYYDSAKIVVNLGY